jgi:regulator of cell morphogenesis and NO signaling
MQNIGKMTIREIALASPATTRVFEEYKIDYCCHGDTPFADACRRVGVSPELVEQEISIIQDNIAVDKSESLAQLPLSDLVSYILDKHHVYTKQEIEHLTPLIEKVARRHGEHNPNLFELKRVFQQICEDLGPHMMKEEMVLFPYIQELESNLAKQLAAPAPHFGTVRNPLRMMTVEHEVVGDLLVRIREITNDFDLPEGACPSFTALYLRLADLERDLHQHIHLENNVLFPRAIELEQKTFLLAFE